MSKKAPYIGNIINFISIGNYHIVFSQLEYITKISMVYHLNIGIQDSILYSKH